MNPFTKKRDLTPSWKLLMPSFRLLRENFNQVIFLYLLPTMTMSLGLILLGNYDFEGPLSPRESQGASDCCGRILIK